MFNIIRSVFFDSKALLVDEFTRKVSDGKKKVSQADKLMSLFANVVEELASSKQHETVFAEAIITMINVASQDLKLKNLFVQPVESASKRVNFFKMICE